VYQADLADPDHVGQPESGARVLARARLAAQLAGDLGHLPHTGRPEWMSHGDQTTRCADRAIAPDLGPPLGEIASALPLAAESQRLCV